MKYRPDIDGLRAVAVLAVIAYHLDTRVTGGFVGVDVFFVISGYLITQIIAGELAEGRFTITGFYRRRLRRIVPALLVMLVGVSVAAAALLIDVELGALQDSLLAAGLFSSNVYFWSSSAAFTGPGTALLHTWSLGVEEQFYILCPLLLLAGHRFFRTRLRLVLALITFGSFLLSAYQVRSGHDNAAFFLLPGRAWELGAGALLALSATRERRPVLRNLAGLAGLLAIAVACVHYTPATSFPGVNALLPVAGAGLVIWAGPHGVAAQLLGQRPVVFVGLISYSLYLWHWPMIVLWKIYTLDPLDRSAKGAILAATFAAAVLSWLLVERPLRRLRLPGRTSVMAFAAASCSVVLLLGFVLQVLSRTVNPVGPESRQLLAQSAFLSDYRSDACFLPAASAAPFQPSRCLRVSASRPNVLLLGDSHAASLRSALSQDRSTNILQATAAGCLPALTPVGGAACTQMMNHVLRDFLPSAKVDAVVLSAGWQAPDARTVVPLLGRLKALVPHVVLIGATPAYTASLPTLIARGEDRQDDAFADRHLIRSRFADDAALRRAASAAGVTFVSALSALCPNGACRERTAAGVPVLADASHLSADGAELVVGTLRRQLAIDLAPGPVLRADPTPTVTSPGQRPTVPGRPDGGEVVPERPAVPSGVPSVPEPPATPGPGGIPAPTVAPTVQGTPAPVPTAGPLHGQ